MNRISSNEIGLDGSQRFSDIHPGSQDSKQLYEQLQALRAENAQLRLAQSAGSTLDSEVEQTFGVLKQAIQTQGQTVKEFEACFNDSQVSLDIEDPGDILKCKECETVKT